MAFLADGTQGDVDAGQALQEFNGAIGFSGFWSGGIKEFTDLSKLLFSIAVTEIQWSPLVLRYFRRTRFRPDRWLLAATGGILPGIPWIEP